MIKRVTRIGLLKDKATVSELAIIEMVEKCLEDDYSQKLIDQKNELKEKVHERMLEIVKSDLTRFEMKVRYEPHCKFGGPGEIRWTPYQEILKVVEEAIADA